MIFIQKKAAFWAELILLFILLPLFISFGNFPRPILYLILSAACCYIILRNLRTINWRQFWHFPKDYKIWRGVFIRTAILLIFSIIAMIILPHHGWFALPKYNLWLWAAVMVLYPIVSVLPQEIIWRFHLLDNIKNIIPQKSLRIIISAFLFGWVHIIFGSLFSIIATVYLGFQLACAYYQGHKSFWVVWVEHSLAGQIAFTIGLGAYFYNG